MMERSELTRSDMILNNRGLVYYVARGFYGYTRIDIDDLNSIGMVGLIKGVDSFDSNKGIKFSTYAAMCIRNEILMNLRRNKRLELEVSIESPISTDENGGELFFSDILGTDANIVSEKIEYEEERTLLEEGISGLTYREKTLITLRFGLDGRKEKTQKEVARLLGLSQSRVSRIEKQSLEKIKRELQRNGYRGQR